VELNHYRFDNLERQQQCMWQGRAIIRDKPSLVEASVMMKSISSFERRGADFDDLPIRNCFK
jgi:hypothetical protein